MTWEGSWEQWGHEYDYDTLYGISKNKNHYKINYGKTSQCEEAEEHLPT